MQMRFTFSGRTWSEMCLLIDHDLTNYLAQTNWIEYWKKHIYRNLEYFNLECCTNVLLKRCFNCFDSWEVYFGWWTELLKTFFLKLFECLGYEIQSYHYQKIYFLFNFDIYILQIFSEKLENVKSFWCLVLRNLSLSIC